MIICRTPFRISFFGGGTDYPSWYLKNGGQVLSSSIDKYCYISIRYLPPFFEHKLRVVYSRIETCSDLNQIKHPAVRETLRFLKFENGLEIHHDGDLPARSGMGSSSSFTVGLLNALYALRGNISSKRKLASESIHIEQNMIEETVGSQDQIAAAFGGLNHITFHKNGEFDVKPIIISKDRKEELNSYLMLFYTGLMRTASDIAKSYVIDIQNKEKQLKEMYKMVDKGISILQSNQSLYSFGELLHETWKAKRNLSTEITNSVVDNYYERACDKGAIGGKITGAGGGGFLLLFVPLSSQIKVRNELDELLHIPFRFDKNGSQIILYDPEQTDYSELEFDRSKRSICAFRELQTLEQ